MSGLGFIASEKEQVCELCGAIEECRPYGPNGEQICFACGQLDLPATKNNMIKYIFGEDSE